MTEQHDHEAWTFDFGSGEPKGMPDFVLLPPGTYLMRVSGMTLKSEGTPAVYVHMVVARGKHKDDPFRATYWTTEAAMGIFKGFLKACGVNYKGVINIKAAGNNPVGKQLIVKVDQKPDRDDPEKMWNEVKATISVQEYQRLQAERKAAAGEAPPPKPPETETAPPTEPEPAQAAADVEVPPTMHLDEDGKLESWDPE